MNRDKLELIIYNITTTNNWDKKCEILQRFVEAEVKRLSEAMKTMLDDMNNASPEEEIEYWLDTWKHWLKELIE